MGISCTCAHTWVTRHHKNGDLGLLDRSTISGHQPAATSGETASTIEELHRRRKFSAARITVEPDDSDNMITRRTA